MYVCSCVYVEQMALPSTLFEVASFSSLLPIQHTRLVCPGCLSLLELWDYR